MRHSSPTFRPKNIHPARGFTLIELLVVVAIIAILAGLLLPAGQSALNSAKKTTAKQQVVSIATAITAYETEYGCLPSNSGSVYPGPVDSTLVKLLCTTNNSRGIVFMEVQGWKSGKGGTNTNGAFCDPFSATNVYSVTLDTNYANSLANMPAQATPGGSITYSTTLNKHIGVWTIWINKGQKNLINSWD